MSNRSPSPPDPKAIQKLAAQLKQLPSPPAVAARVLSAVMDESASVDQLAQLISMDNALTLRVLAQANSAGIGAVGKVKSVQQASSLLGLSVLQNIALSVMIRETLVRENRRDDPLVMTIWKHSLCCAVAASLLAERACPKVRQAAFAAGLLHDNGRLALLSLFPTEYEELLGRPGLSSDDLLAAEECQFGANHAMLGGWLGRNWGLPEAMSNTALCHHHAPESLEQMESGPLPFIVALANLLAHETMLEGYEPGKQSLRLRLAQSLGLSAEALEDVRQAIPARYAEHAAIFDLNGGGELGFYLEAADRARLRLNETAMALEAANGVLSRRNAVLSALAKAGMTLSECTTVPSLLVECARAMTHMTPGGICIYRVVEDSRVEGVWAAPGGPPRPLRATISDDGHIVLGSPPGMEAGLSGLPEGLVQALRGMASRKAAAALLAGQNATLGLTAAGQYGIYPIGSRRGWQGELLFELSSAAWPISPEDGGFPQLAAMAASHLERLAMAERLQNRADNLTEALRKNQQLHEKMLQAERLAAVGQLAAGAAHEINNPLAIIYARTQLLELKEPDERKKEVLRLVMSQIERISGILRNLMDFARPAVPQFGEVQLSEVLERTAALVRTALEKKAAVIELEIDPGLPLVLGDSKQLEQVFLNLLLNSEQALDQGGAIAVRAWADMDARKVIVLVKDTGMGIAPENLKKIFDPFFTTKEEGKGTGLGLSTAYGIILSHKGDIRVQSQPGRGTAVQVSLPMGMQRNSGSPAARPAAAPAQRQPDSRGCSPELPNLAAGLAALVAQDVAQDAGYGVAQDVTQDAARDAGHGVARDGARDLSQDIAQFGTQDFEDVAAELSYEDDLEDGVVQGHERDVTQETVKNRVPGGESEASRPASLGGPRAAAAAPREQETAIPLTAVVLSSEPSVAAALSRIVAAMGYAVGVASSPQEALERLSGDAPSAMLVHWAFKGGGRNTLLMELARRAQRMRVVLLAAPADDPQAAALTSRGAVAVPVGGDAEALRRAMNQG